VVDDVNVEGLAIDNTRDVIYIITLGELFRHDINTGKTTEIQQEGKRFDGFPKISLDEVNNVLYIIFFSFEDVIRVSRCDISGDVCDSGLIIDTVEDAEYATPEGFIFHRGSVLWIADEFDTTGKNAAHIFRAKASAGETFDKVLDLDDAIPRDIIVGVDGKIYFACFLGDDCEEFNRIDQSGDLTTYEKFQAFQLGGIPAGITQLVGEVCPGLPLSGDVPEETSFTVDTSFISQEGNAGVMISASLFAVLVGMTANLF
jgi:hypothetical protein